MWFPFCIFEIKLKAPATSSSAPLSICCRTQRSALVHFVKSISGSCTMIISGVLFSFFYLRALCCSCSRSVLLLVVAVFDSFECISRSCGHIFSNNSCLKISNTHSSPQLLWIKTCSPLLAQFFLTCFLEFLISERRTFQFNYIRVRK